MTPTTPPPRPPHGVQERRRRRRGALSRMLTAPFPSAAIETRTGTLLRSIGRALAFAAPLLCLAAVALAIGNAWSHRLPMLAPRHRAEALCFALVGPPAFAPPMAIEPGAALMRGRFSPGTPPALAIRAAMRIDDRMVISERTRRVGDFDVATLWLRLPGAARHWLVVGWMEGADLAMCSFRFAGDEDDLTADETAWGERLLARILVPANFRAGTIPAVHLRARRDGTLPTLGPRAGS
ncbi:MAG: hypothetical protein HYR74_13360 [Candidatus Eisenbacteria bacterium]|nr:hypothetical protein [Candidatus Eisenbacteria bacterium]